MANIPVNRSHLDVLADRFADTKDQGDLSAFLTELQKSMVIIPIEPSEEMKAAMKESGSSGTPMKLDKDHQPKFCLLTREDGARAFPVFTSPAQIPEKQKPPAAMTVPFKMAVQFMKSLQTPVKDMIVNPFTKGFVLSEAGGAPPAPGAVMGTAQPTELTEQQFHAIAHVQMSREYLPKQLFADPEKVLSDIKLGKEKYLMDAYRSVYPAKIRVPYSTDDLAVMSLQIEDDLIITRVDLPERYTQEGSPLRIYITEMSGEYGYYLVEKGGKEVPGQIARVTADGTHEKIEDAPDNGAEIEAIMSLIRPS